MGTDGVPEGRIMVVVGDRIFSWNVIRRVDPSDSKLQIFTWAAVVPI